MCFWFGLEMLRLVYKKAFLKYWTITYYCILFDLLSSEKSSIALYKSFKKFLQNWAYRVSKEAKFCPDFKMCKSLKFGEREERFLQKTDFGCNDAFFWEKIFGNFLTQEFYTFLKSKQNSVSFDTLWGKFWRNFFSTLIRVGAIFWKLKGQIR